MEPHLLRPPPLSEPTGKEGEGEEEEEGEEEGEGREEGEGGKEGEGRKEGEGEEEGEGGTEEGKREDDSRPGGAVETADNEMEGEEISDNEPGPPPVDPSTPTGNTPFKTTKVNLTVRQR